ncbi:MAG: lysophospholipid acyltransferase family protein [Candidatus Omnitrophota bacterium]
MHKLVLLMPLELALITGKLMGRLAYLFLPVYSRRAKEHLKAAFEKERSVTQINKIAKHVFQNLGMSIAEIFCLRRMKRRLAKRIYGQGFEKIDAALKNGKGAIILSAHFGNWELLPLYFIPNGYPSNVIARRVYYEKYDVWMELLRKNTGVNVIYRDESPRKILDVLKKNELLGIMPDQDIDSVEGVFVNFFGKPTYTPTAPVALAMKVGCPMLPCFIIREGKRHRIVVEDAVDIQVTDNKENDIAQNTQRWTTLLESYIRRYPEQWVWLHKRWKTRPEKIVDSR